MGAGKSETGQHTHVLYCNFICVSVHLLSVSNGRSAVKIRPLHSLLYHIMTSLIHLQYLPFHSHVYNIAIVNYITTISQMTNWY